MAKGHNIVLNISEDFSAKTFDRPSFNKVLLFIKQHKGQVNLFLVLKWSRFSRNTTEAYQMINDFRKLGIEVNAIEQPIDWSIPQNKYLLAFYLTEPEVDNDMRSKSVVDGMRRANKEGRYLGAAPRGYRSARDSKNKPLLVPNEKAVYITEAFEMMSGGAFTQTETLAYLNKKGFNCSRAQFSILLKNRLYTGKVFVKPILGEEGYWVKGIHEAIVPDEIFEKVDALLNKRRAAKQNCKPKSRDEKLPLRGFLECTSCKSKLTGSRSTGNGGSYYYYHCNECRIRFGADIVNNAFLEKLGDLEFSEKSKNLYLAVVKDILKGSDEERKKEIPKRLIEIKKLEDRLEKLFDEKLDGKTNLEDYESARRRYSERIKILNEELEGFNRLHSDFEAYLSWGFSLLKNIKSHYEIQNIDRKQQLIGSLYPDLMTFEKNELRTIKTNEVVGLVATFNGAFRGSQKKTSQLKTDLFRLVLGTGIEPVRP